MARISNSPFMEQACTESLLRDRWLQAQTLELDYLGLLPSLTGCVTLSKLFNLSVSTSLFVN